MYNKIIFLLCFVSLLIGCVPKQKNIEVRNDVTEIIDEIIVEEQTVSVDITDENNLLSVQQKELLQNFALCYAETLRDTYPSDIAQLFSETEGEERFVNQTAYKTLCEIRNMQKLDLSLEYAKVVYNVDTVYDSGRGIVVELYEDNIQKFRHLMEESYTYNTYHVFVLNEADGRWKIKSHLQEEDFFLLAQEAWEDAQGSTLAEKSENAVALLKADAEENFVLRTENLNEYTEIAVSKEYDREKAVEYAQQWYNKRNPEFLEYDLYGGNCQNFASQCIHAGGMDMDINGTYTCQWKFYGKDLNLKQVASGRSYSFIGVDEFYSYAVYNRSSGLVTQPDIDLKYAQKGDVIQVGAYGKWRHSLVVSDVLTDENGTQTEIILASNTADRWNYPLSAYIYTYPRLIHIDGQI